MRKKAVKPKLLPPFGRSRGNLRPQCGVSMSANLHIFVVKHVKQEFHNHEHMVITAVAEATEAGAPHCGP